MGEIHPADRPGKGLKARLIIIRALGALCLLLLPPAWADAPGDLAGMPGVELGGSGLVHLRWSESTVCIEAVRLSVEHRFDVHEEGSDPLNRARDVKDEPAEN